MGGWRGARRRRRHGGHRDRGTGRRPGRASGGTAAAQAAAARPAPLRLVSISPVSPARPRHAGRQRGGDHHRHLQPAAARRRAAAGAVARDRRVLAADRRRRGLHAGDRLPGRARASQSRRAVAGDSRDRSESSSFKTGELQHAAPAGDPRAARLPAADLDAGHRARRLPGTNAAAQLSAAYAPPAGTFQWQPGYPAQLRSFWSQGKANTLDRGAIYRLRGRPRAARRRGGRDDRVAGAADGRRQGPAEHARVQLRDRQRAAAGDADHLA